MRMIDGAGLSACLVLSAAVFMFDVRPVLAQRSELRTLEDRLILQKQQVRDTEASYADQHKQLDQTEQAMAKNPLRLDPLDHLNQLLSQITELATRSGVEIDAVAPGRSEAADHYVTVPIGVAGRGRFEALARFVQLMHQRLPDTAVAELNLAGNPGAADGVGTFRFELLWYAAPRQAAVVP